MNTVRALALPAYSITSLCITHPTRAYMNSYLTECCLSVLHFQPNLSSICDISLSLRGHYHYISDRAVGNTRGKLGYKLLYIPIKLR